jgi:hypothetical protein
VIITFDCDLVKSYSRDKRSESFEISASHDMPRWSKHLPDISEEEQHDSVKTKSDNVVSQIFKNLTRDISTTTIVCGSNIVD